MADERLQELERAWRTSASFDDEVAYLRERVRTGDLDRSGESIGGDRLGDYRVWAAALSAEEFARRLPPRLLLYHPSSNRWSVERQREALSTPTAEVHVLRVEGGSTLDDTTIATVGRDPMHNVVLPHPTVSRQHAYFQLGRGEVHCFEAAFPGDIVVDGQAVSTHFSRPVTDDSWVEFRAQVTRVCAPAVLHRLAGDLNSLTPPTRTEG